MIVDYHMHLRAPDESIDHSVEAIEHARAAGYDTVTVFDQREARQEPLG